ncbi:hypothetical protein QFC21_007017 [Naganishia friedmannii]|uniref:Uncharacterized protein n=1 Tax=Naganishia friedmannii TaxID=89922 RepID=A0ACC2UZ48_9TREE|nr:hypothetical protein QFC21_007017 [Naganishia friedmannii]
MPTVISPASISVHVRLRPWKQSDGPHTKDAISLSESTISVPNPQRAEQRFKFTLDGCHGPESEQEDLFAMVKPIKHRSVDSSMKISFSYVEILMEEIFDLLVPRNVTKKLDVRTNAAGENVIPDLTKKPINSASEFEAIYQAAAVTRKTASTKLNSNSSRSHAILTIYVETVDARTQQNLAGSEDNNLTGNDPTRMRESAAINRSLTTLGSVVESLNSKASRIPYRDSKLTRILQDALGGSSIGMLICNLAPGDRFAKEALRTLKFATRTREIENRPVVNTKVAATLTTNVICPSRRVSVNAMAETAQSVDALSKSILPSPRPTDLNRTIAAEIKKSGLGVTEKELDTRIQSIVNSMLQTNTRSVQQTQKPLEVVKEDIPSLADYVEDERKARAKVLINLARTHHDKGELELSLEYYRKAKVYVPDNQKLSRRIAEIELASMGQIPLPMRSGSSKLPQIVDERGKLGLEATSPLPATLPGSVQAQHRYNANRNEVPNDTTCSNQSSDKQPKIKRSTALSRPLADITKNLNLASLLTAPGPEGKARKGTCDVVSKHRKGVPTTGSTVAETTNGRHGTDFSVSQQPILQATRESYERLTTFEFR